MTARRWSRWTTPAFPRWPDPGLRSRLGTLGDCARCDNGPGAQHCRNSARRRSLKFLVLAQFAITLQGGALTDSLCRLERKPSTAGFYIQYLRLYVLPG